jgi:DNA-binding NtrC family response regulator
MTTTQIVIAEDEGEIRNLIAECLIERGFRVKQAVDGLKALQLIEAAKGLIILITDMRMPRMSGQELVEKALAIRPELKVVLITGYPGELPTGGALMAREIKTFMKPFNLNKLCDYVELMARRA